MGLLVSRLTGRRYRLLARLGKGGMGEVFVGQEVGPKADVGRPLVAIKTVISESASDRDALERFLDEARLSARLSDPNVARMLDFGFEAGRPFACFELLHGADLHEVEKALVVAGQKMPVDVAAALIRGACLGVHHVHTLEENGRPLGAVHRDLSPSNLFLTSTGQVKVLDFGAAWSRDRVARTLTNHVVGKAEYLAPEQARGKQVTPRTDVFALGLCLYELLALQRPYAIPGLRSSQLPGLIAEARFTPLAELRPELPRALLAACERATAREPSNRFRSALELADALAESCEDVRPARLEQRLASFYRECFGSAREEARQQRLEELMAHEPRTAAFEWSAPELWIATPPAVSERLGAARTLKPGHGRLPKTEPHPAIRSAPKDKAVTREERAPSRRRKQD